MHTIKILCGLWKGWDKTCIVDNHLAKSLLNTKNIQTIELGKDFVNVHPLKKNTIVINEVYCYGAWCPVMNWSFGPFKKKSVDDVTMG